jgi:ketosteroid isomerase-like protein
MKMLLLPALVGLAMSFALPSIAQQTTADPQLRQQLLALAKRFDDAYNNNDAAALAALYTEDSVEVMDKGPVYGREAIEKYYTDLFQKVHFSNHLTTYNDPNSPHNIGTDGNEMWENGEWSCTITVQGQSGDPIQLKGYHSSIAVREGDDWKKRMITWNITPAPATTKTATAETK